MSAPEIPETSAGVTEFDEMGPIDYLVIEFPGNRMTGEGLPLLLDLVERGIIRILDLEFLRVEPDRSISRLAVGDIGDVEVDLTMFSGARSGLLDDDDVGQAGAVVEPGCSAAILVYENTWAAPLARKLRRGGAQMVASGRIPVQALLASLDTVESSASPR